MTRKDAFYSARRTAISSRRACSVLEGRSDLFTDYAVADSGSDEYAQFMDMGYVKVTEFDRFGVQVFFG